MYLFSSVVEFSQSYRSQRNGSSNIGSTSSKLILCFLMFAFALSSSHSKRPCTMVLPIRLIIARGSLMRQGQMRGDWLMRLAKSVRSAPPRTRSVEHGVHFAVLTLHKTRLDFAAPPRSISPASPTTTRTRALPYWLPPENKTSGNLEKPHISIKSYRNKRKD